jgi:dienelactone hydrolase
LYGTILEYFPGEYRWSEGLRLALTAEPYGGAEIGEIDIVGRRLMKQLGDDTAWFKEWKNMGEHIESIGKTAEEEGHALTAAGCYLRACNYYQIGERFRQPKDQEALQTFRRSVYCFKKAAELIDWPLIEYVEVPFGSSSMPAYFVKNNNEDRNPVVVYFDGLDSNKELLYFSIVPDIVKRGISCLIVDSPGNGESIRFRGMTLRPDYEKPGSAALDYLQTRSDVDVDRACLLGISLGGYYAPRAVAFEKRYKACVAWGAIYDYHEIWKNRIEKGFNAALSSPGEQIKWILGVDSYEDALRLLEDYKLVEIAKDIECKVCIVHGEEDKQIPLKDAQKLFDAIGSKEKTLKIFASGEGGAEHCQGDNRTFARTYISDWIADNI